MWDLKLVPWLVFLLPQVSPLLLPPPLDPVLIALALILQLLQLKLRPYCQQVVDLLDLRPLVRALDEDFPSDLLLPLDLHLHCSLHHRH